MWDRECSSPVAVMCGEGIRLAGWNWLGRGDGGRIVGLSCESEVDLGAMVLDFLEGSCGNDSMHSSDGDLTISDIAHLHNKILTYRGTTNQYESDLRSVVHSFFLSTDESNLLPGKQERCDESCIRFSLVKLLQSCGYDAAVCASKWQGFGKVPGETCLFSPWVDVGEHYYIDVINHHDGGFSERYIIEIDFRSHFEIARAIKPYNALLDALPAVYVGSVTKLKQFLQTMADAARISLKQNSMPLPPWRSFAYLEAKWETVSRRGIGLHNPSSNIVSSITHKHCTMLLRRLKSCLESDIRKGGSLSPRNIKK